MQPKQVFWIRNEWKKNNLETVLALLQEQQVNTRWFLNENMYFVSL